MPPKPQFFLISIFLFIILINSSLSTVLVKAGDKINNSCENNAYYLQIDVIFSEKPKKEQYFFTLNLLFPENLSFKCVLDYSKNQINCLRALSNINNINSNFQLPYPFPELEDIEWDYETFLKKVYRKNLRTEQDCGKEDIIGTSTPDNKKWDLEASILSINNEKCYLGSVNNDKNNKYNFDINLSFEKGEMLDLIKNANNTGINDIELMQEIWIPLIPNKNDNNKFKLDKKNFPLAICKAKDKINKNNLDKFVMNCYIPIPDDIILKGVIDLNSFFDKLYIKQNNILKIISIFIKINNKENENNYLSLSDNNKDIICPNLPMLTITNKYYITMGDYYSDTNKYSFIIVGTLSNGYLPVNETIIELNETNSDIIFNLKVEDNLVKPDQRETDVSCTIPISSPFNMKNFVTIKCIGEKKFSSFNKNVDIILNWNLNENKFFKNIIISWPKTYDKSTTKNIFGYQLTGLSIKQSNFGCHENNFDFFVYIYNLYSQPKLNFNLPIALPKNAIAKCEIFDPTALRCSLNLKHKKLSKGDKVKLPPLGTEYDIFNGDGNRITFKMNNFTKIKNDHDFYVELESGCGDNVVIGTLKDMGIPHTDSIIIFIFVIIGIVFISIGGVIYCFCKIRMRMKRGAKLTTNEEIKDNPGNATTGIKA